MLLALLFEILPSFHIIVVLYCRPTCFAILVMSAPRLLYVPSPVTTMDVHAQSTVRLRSIHAFFQPFICKIIIFLIAQIIIYLSVIFIYLVQRRSNNQIYIIFGYFFIGQHIALQYNRVFIFIEKSRTHSYLFRVLLKYLSISAFCILQDLPTFESVSSRLVIKRLMVLSHTFKYSAACAVGIKL